jgi:hypothetical protein
MDPVPPVQACRDLNDSLTSGGVLAAVGGAAAVAGTVLIALPPRR